MASSNELDGGCMLWLWLMLPAKTYRPTWRRTLLGRVSASAEHHHATTWQLQFSTAAGMDNNAVESPKSSQLLMMRLAVKRPSGAPGGHAAGQPLDLWDTGVSAQCNRVLSACWCGFVLPA